MTLFFSSFEFWPKNCGFTIQERGHLASKCTYIL